MHVFVTSLTHATYRSQPQLQPLSKDQQRINLYLLSPVEAPALFSMPCLNTNISGPSGVGCLLISPSHYPSARQTWPTLRQRTRHLCWRHQPVWDEAKHQLQQQSATHFCRTGSSKKNPFKYQSWDVETREESGNEAFTLLGRYVAWAGYRRFGKIELAYLEITSRPEKVS